MKKIISVLSVIVMSLFSPVHSLDVGSRHYGNETLGVLIFNGHLTLNGTTIQDRLAVNGSLVAENVVIEKLIVNGQVTLTGAHIEGKSEINGYLIADNTELHNLLSLSSNKLDLIDSLTQNIIIKKNIDSRLQQVVNLKNTKVYGDIVFEGDNGVVLADEDSFVEGEVIGGTLSQKE